MSTKRFFSTALMMALFLTSTGYRTLAQQPAPQTQKASSEDRKAQVGGGRLLANRPAQAHPNGRAGFSLMPLSSSNLIQSRFTITPMTGGNLPVLGSGTLGRLTKWTGFTSSNAAIGDSNIYEDKFGKVGIGTDSPTSRLTVAGVIESTGGFKFPDGTVQTSSATGALFSVAHDATLQGNGTPVSPLGAAIPLSLSGSTGAAILDVTNNGTGNAIRASSSDGFGIVAAIENVGFQLGPLRAGILGVANTANGALGVSLSGNGVTGISGSHQTSPCLDFSSIGMCGHGSASGAGVLAQGGESTGSAGKGVESHGGDVALGGFGLGGDGIFAFGGKGAGAGQRGGAGIHAQGGSGTGGASVGPAGLFEGDVVITGKLQVTSGMKMFHIDHPLDPENKYLNHAAIESSEVLNIYSGNVTTDENGNAVVALPAWFEALNSDFRYQLTVVGTFSQAIVAEKIKGNRFVIKTNAPAVEVSWQVTGLRSDATARKYRFEVEEEKGERERGYYSNPDAYGQPEERSIEWARNPQMMQHLKQRRVEAEQMREHKRNDR